MIARVGYLGPEATFTEQATGLLRLPSDVVTVAMPDVAAVLDAVAAGAVDAGMVPIENSVEGGVNTTLDALSNGPELRIVAEVLLPVSFVLAGRAGTTLAGIRTVLSHGHGLAQCRHWVAEHLPGATMTVTTSTAQAAATVAAGGDPGAAAVCAAVAAERYGLTVLARDVGDRTAAVTRFVLIARPGTSAGRLPEPTGSDRTSLVLFIRANHPGALLEVLEQFAVRGVDLTRLESRPTGAAMGEYCFAVDVEGHLDDARVGEALSGLHRLCREVRFLGSYPRGDGARTRVRDGTADADYTSSAAWLAGLREPAGGEPAGSESARGEPAGREPAGSEPAGREPAGREAPGGPAGP